MKLYDAVKEGDVSKLKHTLSDLPRNAINKKYDLSGEHRFGWTALHIAVASNEIEIARHLLDAGADVNVQEDKDDQTPLILAAGFGYTALVELLISYKADINLQQLDGDTPLLKASSDGFTDIVAVLLKNGADIHLTDNLGWTPLVWAATNGHKDIVRMLIESHNQSLGEETNADRTALLIAASLGNTEITKLLLQGKYNGSSPNIQKAMMAAATNGHFDIVALLKKLES
ncbi:ankyrin repeat domain-containing protein [Leptospira ognonensis]|uniref:Ankyrin repeat domain-containing protein n=1 Tax=Leptospira ognonensis TaxID=2484945 RepID=A0A4R9KD96_9LEPT|nr:ankyrin repeat domain-containing protein [Leptospira ognonensis]TGL63905.1 ankyrin repeat domain-containing protein [Leptospira ognonensis]